MNNMVPLANLLQELDEITFEQLYQETIVFDETGVLSNNSLIRTLSNMYYADNTYHNTVLQFAIISSRVWKEALRRVGRV